MATLPIPCVCENLDLLRLIAHLQRTNKECTAHVNGEVYVNRRWLHLLVNP